MCGIAGIIAPNSRKYARQLQSMVEALSHRGPDGHNHYIFPKCALGHTRLSIIDLVSGTQPMLSRDKSIGLVFNGEIYGFKEIKKQLKQSEFITTSDTEVLLVLYELYGTELLNDLPGMFAFAIYDRTKDWLFCARDRFGEKPFYYAFGSDGEFIFASEIKAILATNLIKPRLSKLSLQHYFKHLYIHPYQTIYENIYTLPPAHYLIYKDRHLSVKRYWSAPSSNSEIELEDAIPQFKKLLLKAVKNQLISDVPLGCFLSGGLDSSTIVALASQYQAKLNTFTLSFKESRSELAYAQEVANKYHTNHVILEDSDFDIAKLITLMQQIYDEPFADSSNIPTYLISQLARKYVTVAISGDGCDELLGGYGWYKSLFYMQNNTKRDFWKLPLLRFFASINKRIKTRNCEQWRHQYQGLKERNSNFSLLEAHYKKNTYFRPRDFSNLNFPIYQENNHIMSWHLTDTVDDALRMDVENYMPGDILVKTDRASMANSLELRSPFLDFDFASFCMSLPYRLKITKDTDKYILRKAFSDLWPVSVQNRSKQGFGAPVDKWLKLPEVSNLTHKYLHNKRRKIFNIVPFESCRNYVKMTNYHTWILLILSMWMETHDFVF